jgi:hypothetical protein
MLAYYARRNMFFFSCKTFLIFGHQNPGSETRFGFAILKKCWAQVRMNQCGSETLLRRALMKVTDTAVRNLTNIMVIFGWRNTAERIPAKLINRTTVGRVTCLKTFSNVVFQSLAKGEEIAQKYDHRSCLKPLWALCTYRYNLPVLRIHDILVCGSGSADPCLWPMGPDADPSIFIIDLQDANKKLPYF